MHFPSILAAAIAAAAILPAQTQALLGKVELDPNTVNSYRLAGTHIPVKSSAVKLNTIAGQPCALKVIDVGGPGQPVLDVSSASPTNKTFVMGTLVMGKSDQWEVVAPAGSFVSVYVTPTAKSEWLPLDSQNVWLLGQSFAGMGSGLADANGVFKFSFTAPKLPELIGTSFTAQALVGTPTAGLVTWSVTAADEQTFAR
jgi:hypothetical protein